MAALAAPSKVSRTSCDDRSAAGSALRASISDGRRQRGRWASISGAGPMPATAHAATPRRLTGSGAEGPSPAPRRQPGVRAVGHDPEPRGRAGGEHLVGAVGSPSRRRLPNTRKAIAIVTPPATSTMTGIRAASIAGVGHRGPARGPDRSIVDRAHAPPAVRPAGAAAGAVRAARAAAAGPGTTTATPGSAEAVGRGWPRARRVDRRDVVGRRGVASCRLRRRGRGRRRLRLRPGSGRRGPRRRRRPGRRLRRGPRRHRRLGRRPGRGPRRRAGGSPSAAGRLGVGVGVGSACGVARGVGGRRGGRGRPWGVWRGGRRGVGFGVGVGGSAWASAPVSASAWRRRRGAGDRHRRGRRRRLT